MKQTVNVEEAARLACRTRRTIYKWIHDGWLELTENPSQAVAYNRRIVTESLLRHAAKASRAR